MAYTLCNCHSCVSVRGTRLGGSCLFFPEQVIAGPELAGTSAGHGSSTIEEQRGSISESVQVFRIPSSGFVLCLVMAPVALEAYRQYLPGFWVSAPTPAWLTCRSAGVTFDAAVSCPTVAGAWIMRLDRFEQLMALLPLRGRSRGFYASGSPEDRLPLQQGCLRLW